MMAKLFSLKVGLIHLKSQDTRTQIHILRGPVELGYKASACNVGDPGLIPGSGRSLEKEMATHSSTLAWRIPWIEEPGGL